MTKMRLFTAVLLALLAVGLGCADGEKQLGIPTVIHTTEEEPSLTKEQERIRRMSKITIQRIDAITSEVTSSYEVDGHGLTEEMVPLCRFLCAEITTFNHACKVDSERCVAERLLEIGKSPDAPIQFTRMSGSVVVDHIRVLPRGVAANAAVLAEARKVGQNLTFLAMDYLQGEPGPGMSPIADPDITYLLPHTLPGGTTTELAEQVMVNALELGVHVMTEASYLLADTIMDAAQWQLGSSASFPVATRRASSAHELSRAAAAHILVGGADGLAMGGKAIDGFCTAAPLTPGATLALEVLREAAVPPDYLFSQDANALVNSVEFLNQGSVRERLAITRTEPRLLLDPDEGGVRLLSYLQLRLEDFAEAQEYLKQEYTAFARTDTAVSELTIGQYERYLSTSITPRQRLDAFYSAVARSGKKPLPAQSSEYLTYFHEDAFLPAEGGPKVFPSNYYPAYDLAKFLDLVANRMAAVTINNPFAEPAGDVLHKLELLLEDLRAQVPITVSYEDLGSQNLVRIRSTKELANVRLVRGEDALDCIVTGSIEGRDCDDLEWDTTAVIEGFGHEPNSTGGFDHVYGRTVAEAIFDTYASSRFYVVAEQIPGEELRPEQRVLVFGALHGFDIYASSTSVRAEYLPEAEAKVAAILAPSQSWCSRGSVECDGSLFDDRVPLENELANNNDGVENSWQLYLDRAEQAALKADEFGEAYLDAIGAVLDSEVAAGREFEDRERWAESELEALQAICGVTLDLPQLMEKLGVSEDIQGDLTQVGSTPCSTDADCAAAEECLTEACIPSPIALLDDDIDNDRRLRECLGEGTVTEYATTGSVPLCVTIDQNGEFCSAYREPWLTHLCPATLTTNAEIEECEQGGWFGSTVQSHVIDTTLKLYEPTLTRYAPEASSQVYALPAMGCWYRYPEDEQDTDVYSTDIYGYSIYNNPGEHPDLACEITDENATQTFTHWIGRDVLYLNQVPMYAGQRSRAIYFRFKGCDHPLDLESLAELPPTAQFWIMERYAECRGVDVRSYLSRRVLARVPERAVEVIERYGVSGTFPAVGGQYGEALSALRAGLLRYSENANLIGDKLFDISHDLRIARDILGQVGIRKGIAETQASISELELAQVNAKMDIVELQDELATFNAFAAPVERGAASGHVGGFFAGFYDTARALQSKDQLDQERRILAIEREILAKQGHIARQAAVLEAIEKNKTLVQARANVRRHMRSVEGLVTEARAGFEEFEASLQRLENLRESAKRALRRVVRIMSKTSEAYETHATFLNFDAQLKRQAYEEARASAVRQAFLAKRAIEQRLGMRFSSMLDDLPLVGAPALWENDVCVASGIDFQRLQAEGTAPTGEALPYVWEYVDRLRRTVESYRLQYGFQEGTDVTVLSLKEDIYNTKRECEVPHLNLLTWSSLLDQIDREDGTGWSIQGCQGCITVSEPGDIVEAPSYGNPPIAFTISFDGPGRLAQDVNLSAGDYVLSWVRSADAASGSLVLFDNAGAEIQPVSGQSIELSGWYRHWAVYSIPEAGDYKVAFDSGNLGLPGSIGLAGAMLEVREDVDTFPEPSLYQERGLEATQIAPVCADLNGEVFRARWQYRCIPLCPNGLGQDCPDDYASPRCFWETTFPLSQARFESGAIGSTAGFAIGNFNYRTELVGVNFVGTELRSCDANSGLSCFGIGSIPYTFEHHGAFVVRNHRGEDFSASLFDGRIEHARGLATERYLTNPLSSADSELLSPYLRTEFRGRPLDGNYVLRVWNEQGVDFEEIEDIQLYLKYRYWTRFD